MFQWIRKILGLSGQVKEAGDSELQIRFEKLEKRVEILTKANIELTKNLEEVLDVADSEALEELEKMREKRNSDLRVINNNFDIINEKIKVNEKKYDGVLEVIADKMTEHVPIDVLSGEISLRKILKRKNQSEGALLATVYLLKKYFDNKGVRV